MLSIDRIEDRRGSNTLAKQAGMGGRINTIMQTCYFGNRGKFLRQRSGTTWFFGAKMAQTAQAFLEADSYSGPSLIVAYRLRLLSRS
jgi:hypothetical protein